MLTFSDDLIINRFPSGRNIHSAGIGAGFCLVESIPKRKNSPSCRANLGLSIMGFTQTTRCISDGAILSTKCGFSRLILGFYPFITDGLKSH